MSSLAPCPFAYRKVDMKKECKTIVQITMKKAYTFLVTNLRMVLSVHHLKEITALKRPYCWRVSLFWYLVNRV